MPGVRGQGMQVLGEAGRLFADKRNTVRQGLHRPLLLCILTHVVSALTRQPNRVVCGFSSYAFGAERWRSAAPGSGSAADAGRRRLQCQTVSKPLLKSLRCFPHALACTGTLPHPLSGDAACTITLLTSTVLLGNRVTC